MILITGATGFIGSRLAENLHSAGEKLVLLGRSNNDVELGRSKHLQSLGLTVNDVDLVGQELGPYVEGVRAVVHLAAAQHEANRPESYFRSVNVTGTQQLLDASLAAKVKRFVYGSTIGVYGNVMAGNINDQTPEAPDNHYGRTKLAAEKLVESYDSKIEISIARISETYGPGDFRLLKLFSGIQKKYFFVIGPGQNLHQLIYVDDLVAALREMVENDSVVNQTLVLAGDEVVTTNEMCEAISNAVNQPLRRVRLPMWPFVVAAVVLENTLGRMGIQPPLHRRRLDFFRKSLSFNSEKRKSLLKWKPTVTFANGAMQASAWYKNMNLLDAE